jgi:8-oxo-dGTP diphosphatase
MKRAMVAVTDRRDRGPEIMGRPLSHARGRFRSVSREELQQQSLQAALGDVGLARLQFDDVAGWLAAAGASPADRLGAEVWVFDADLTQVLLVRHPWRGWVPPGGKVEPGETPREAACREVREETGLEAELLARPAAVSIRSYHPDAAATLGLSYCAIADPAAPLVSEPGQPVAWINLDYEWESCFSDDPPRIRQHAQWLAGIAPSELPTGPAVDLPNMPD